MELGLTNLDDEPMPAGLGLHPWFLTREKVETERTITKDRWAHAAISYIEASRLPPS